MSLCCRQGLTHAPTKPPSYLDSHDIIRPASMRYTSFLAEGIASDRLFKFDHLADARLIALVQPHQIDPSGDGLALGIPTVPS